RNDQSLHYTHSAPLMRYASSTCERKPAGFAGKQRRVEKDGLEAAGVARVLNPFDDAADYAARSLCEEIRSKEEIA
ncbi:MAG: hypothetical protein WA210_16070, partial [Burkholderiaceae bacterium]